MFHGRPAGYKMRRLRTIWIFILAGSLPFLTGWNFSFFANEQVNSSGGGGGPTMGYFILIPGPFQGNLGALSAADTTCLTELQNNVWMGKGSVSLSSSNVKAFLCDSVACNNLAPSTTYAFAVSRNATLGGATFVTDGSGAGPNDTANWSAGTYFGSVDYFWTNRAAGTSMAWGTGPFTTTSNSICTNWSSTNSARSAVPGYTSDTTQARWSSTTMPCNSSLKLICFVNPF
jgi:hypothetical protein